jgi:membrane protease YdiL (CAAX protease family)
MRAVCRLSLAPPPPSMRAMPAPGPTVAIAAVALAAAGLIGGGLLAGPDAPPLVAVLCAQGGALLPVLLVLLRWRPAVCGLAAPRPEHLVAGFALAPAAMLASLLGGGLQYWLGTWAGFQPEAEHVEQVLGGLRDTVGWAGLVALACVVPGLVEESLFRGVVLHGLRRRLSAPAAVLICALLFAAVHMSPWRILPQCALGCILGWLTLRCGSMWPAAAAHACHNLLVLAITLGGERLAPLVVGAVIAISIPGAVLARRWTAPAPA